MCTSSDIESEHKAALASLSPAQRRAIARLELARQQSNFNHRWPSENLAAIFAEEASRRAA